MHLTTRGRYAVTAILDVVLHSQRAVPLAAVAARQSLPLAYLEQLFARLRRAGLVHGQRGAAGGYSLARSADLISVADVVRAVNEPVDATRCRGLRNCQDDQPCLTHDLWAGLSRNIEQFLESVSLAELARRPPVRAAARRQDAAELRFHRDAAQPRAAS